ncbi:MAG: hypothetical protein K9L83_03215 [Deltaproteobacteria bacterium]|nr:hypothetical protein [Deltaproteobacteria bacterium]
MKIPEYVSIEEVKRVCKELKLTDWTRKKEPKVSLKEAKIILGQVNRKKMEIDPKEFQTGLEVELEHGFQYKDANVTNNHPLLTGLIVLAHLKESLDYYRLLEVAELEGDLLKAVTRGQAQKTKAYYERLAKARILLRKAELKRLAS